MCPAPRPSVWGCTVQRPCQGGVDGKIAFLTQKTRQSGLRLGNFSPQRRAITGSDIVVNGRSEQMRKAQIPRVKNRSGSIHIHVRGHGNNEECAGEIRLLRLNRRIPDFKLHAKARHRWRNTCNELGAVIGYGRHGLDWGSCFGRWASPSPLSCSSS